jgi:hypothetical protein
MRGWMGCCVGDKRVERRTEGGEGGEGCAWEGGVAFSEFGGGGGGDGDACDGRRDRVKVAGDSGGERD